MKTALAVLFSLLSLSVYAATPNLADRLIEEGALAERSEETSTVLFEISEDPSSCDEEPCYFRIDANAGLGTMWSAGLALRPIPAIILEGGASFNVMGHPDDTEIFKQVKGSGGRLGSGYGGVYAGARVSVLNGVVELGGRYQPFRASDMTDDFNQKIRELGYDARINFLRIDDDSVGSVKFFIAVTGLRKDWAPNFFQIGVSTRLR